MPREIVTWNSQGGKWGDLRDVFTALKEDEIPVFCVQEAGVAARGMNRIETETDYWLYEWELGTSSRSRKRYYTYYQWGEDNVRCSLGIITNARPEEVVTIAGKRRPCIGVRISDDLPWFFTLHATSGYNGKNDAEDLLEGILQLVGDSEWIAAGDFNAEPGELKSHLWRVRPPEKPTHKSGRRLDYVVQSSDLMVTEVCQAYHPRQGLLDSDHIPQIADF